MKQYNVGIIGATGMVGQRFATLLENHPWFNVKVLAASPRSAGQTYEQAAGSRWKMAVPMPAAMKDMVLMDATNDIEKIAGMVDFCFCAVDMKKDEIKALEEAYAKAECPIVSNNSAHRFTPDVPMVVPEINPEHIEIIKAQRDCSIQSYVPALHPLRKFGLKNVLACTYQAISGAGKNFETWPEMVDNLIPFIGGEEEKSEQEPLKVWGEIKGTEIVKATAPNITTQCLREELELPSAPKQFIHYFEEDNRPQAKLDRNLEGGMAVSTGRLREDSQYDYKFVCLSHNTLRGAAGGGVLLAELLAAKGYFD